MGCKCRCKCHAKTDLPEWVNLMLSTRDWVDQFGQEWICQRSQRGKRTGLCLMWKTEECSQHFEWERLRSDDSDDDSDDDDENRSYAFVSWGRNGYRLRMRYQYQNADKSYQFRLDSNSEPYNCSSSDDWHFHSMYCLRPAPAAEPAAELEDRVKKMNLHTV